MDLPDFLMVFGCVMATNVAKKEANGASRASASATIVATTEINRTSIGLKIL